MSVFLIAAPSCGDFDDVNRNPNLMDKVNPGSLLNPMLYNLAVFNWGRSYRYTFLLMQVTVSTMSTRGISYYDISPGEGDGTWTAYYRWMLNAREMEKLAVETNEPNYRAIALTLHSWLAHLLTDIYGDIPLTEACRGEEGLFTPVFDSQHDVYRQIVNDLLLANSLFNVRTGLRYNPGDNAEILFGTNESLDSGNTSPGVLKWKKWCNSLLLRVLTRASGSGIQFPVTIGDVLGDPGTYPVFTANDDEALLYVSGIFPLEGPLARPQDFQNYVTGTTFMIDDVMGKWYDNRRGVLYKTTAVPGVGNRYVGYPSGFAVAPNLGYVPSKMNIDRAQPPLDIVLMTLAEVEFIKAEYYLKNGNFEQANAAYLAGIKASHDQWGVAVATSGGGMLNNAAVKLTEGDDSGNFEKIMLQKYIALVFCDYQQWFEHNRTGFPVLPRGDGVPDGYDMPRRLLFPATIQRTNMENYRAALARMGSDVVSTRLFWQHDYSGQP